MKFIYRIPNCKEKFKILEIIFRFGYPMFCSGAPRKILPETGIPVPQQKVQ